MSGPVLSAYRVCKTFGGAGGRPPVQAVDQVTLDVQPGETLGLVGESGSGKSTLGRALLQLDPPTSGEVMLSGRRITGLGERELRPLRREMQMVFQDPQSSLNPRMTVRQIVAEPLAIHRVATGRAEREARVRELLDLVRLPSSALDRYPHEFSGGQRQRIGIARAIALRPRLIIADEAVSALDVSVQAQVVNLLMDLQEELHFAQIFIAHDLAVVRHIASRVAVMFLGRILELAPNDALFANPVHPYTRSLIDAVPIPDPEREAHRVRLAGELRRARYPAELKEVAPGHFVAAGEPE